jgi:D-alanyl-D-alanine carboxypeptidase/D-alanyl-D-alanine-endopeptidase (penicillin-binding protein 4)
VVALDQLGPVYAWNTPALVDGPLVQGKLQGSLYLTGRGDPRLVTEKLWLLLSRLQQLGLREIGGDIVIDRSAFELAEVDPGAFDGERFRPYNVQPDAFVVNGKALMLSFHPEPALGLARVGMEPALAGVTVPASVPLLRGDRPADCGDWRGQLQADFSSPDQIRLAGRFPAACGDKTWPVAYADPASFNSRAVAAAWRDLGGKLAGRVREGKAPATASLLQDFPSPLLPEVLRDMNKFSNNLIAQQIFLTLSLAGQGTGRYEASREIVHSRLREKASCSDAEFKIDKGSGLSRQERITAGCLARVLQWAWLSPWMPELLSSLPLAGIEATARRSTGAVGRAHIKTGTLNGVSAIAGYVHGSDGQRRIVVAMINHPLAGGDDSRQVLDAVLRLAAEDLDTRP